MPVGVQYIFKLHMQVERRDKHWCSAHIWICYLYTESWADVYAYVKGAEIKEEIMLYHLRKLHLS